MGTAHVSFFPTKIHVCLLAATRKAISNAASIAPMDLLPDFQEWRSSAFSWSGLWLEACERPLKKPPITAVELGMTVTYIFVATPGF